jgi:hypothetical protein
VADSSVEGHAHRARTLSDADLEAAQRLATPLCEAFPGNDEGYTRTVKGAEL